MASKEINMYSKEDILRALSNTKQGGKAGGGSNREDQRSSKSKAAEATPRRNKPKSASTENGSTTSSKSAAARDVVPPSNWISAPSPAIPGRFSRFTIHERQFHSLDIMVLQNPSGLHVVNCSGLPQFLCGSILVSNVSLFQSPREFVDWSTKLVAILPRVGSSLAMLDGDANQRIYKCAVTESFPEIVMLLPLAQEVVSAVPAVKRSQLTPQVNPVQIHFPPEDGEVLGPDSAHIIMYLPRASAEIVRNGAPVGAVRCYARHAMDVALHCAMIHRALSVRIGQEFGKALVVFPSLLTHSINLSFPAKAEIIYRLILGNSVSRNGCLAKLFTTSDSTGLTRHPGEIIMAEFPFLLVWDAASLMGLPYDDRLTTPDFSLAANVHAYAWKVPVLQSYPVGIVIAALLCHIAEVEGKDITGETILPVAHSCLRVGMRGDSLLMILSAPLPPLLSSRLVQAYTSASLTVLQSIPSDGPRHLLLKALRESVSKGWSTMHTPALPHGSLARPLATAPSYPPVDLEVLQDDLRRLAGSVDRLTGQVDEFQLGVSEHDQLIAQAQEDLLDLQAVRDLPADMRALRMELSRFKTSTKRDIEALRSSQEHLEGMVADYLSDFNRRLRALEGGPGCPVSADDGSLRSGAPVGVIANTGTLGPPSVSGVSAGVHSAGTEDGATVFIATAENSDVQVPEAAVAPAGEEGAEDDADESASEVDPEASEDADASEDEDVSLFDTGDGIRVRSDVSSAGGAPTRPSHIPNNRLGGGRVFVPFKGLSSRLVNGGDEDWDGDIDPALLLEEAPAARKLLSTYSRTIAPPRLTWVYSSPRSVFLDTAGCAETSVEVLNKEDILLSAGLSPVASLKGELFLRITLLLPAEGWGISLLLPLRWAHRTEGLTLAHILDKSPLVVHRLLVPSPSTSSNSRTTHGVLVWEATAIPGWVTLVTAANGGDLSSRLQVAVVKGVAYSLRASLPFRLPLLASMASLAISSLDLRLGALQQSATRVIAKLPHLELRVGDFTLLFDRQTQATAALLLHALSRENFDLTDEELMGIPCKVSVHAVIPIEAVDFGGYHLIHAFAAGAYVSAEAPSPPPTFIFPQGKTAPDKLQKASVSQRKAFLSLFKCPASHPEANAWEIFSKLVNGTSVALKTAGPFGDLYLLKHMQEHQWLGLAWKSLGDDNWGLYMGTSSPVLTLGALFHSQDCINIAFNPVKADMCAGPFALARLPNDAKATIIRAFKEALESALEMADPPSSYVHHALDPLGLAYSPPPSN